MEAKDDIRERKKMSWQGWTYSAQRIDFLIITICGAGIYVVLETIKFALERKNLDISFLKVSGGIFALSIVINFLSQLTGKWSNHHDMRWCHEKLCADDTPTKKQIKDACLLDEKAERLSNVTNILNTLSMGIMFVALAILCTYYFITF